MKGQLAELFKYEKDLAVKNGAEIYKDLTICREEGKNGDRWYVRIWLRKQSKPLFNYQFRSLQARELFITEQKASADRREQEKAQYHPHNDDRSKKMKDILRAAYPHNQFSVTIQKYSMGECIHVKTDLMVDTWGLAYDEVQNKSIYEANRKVEDHIKVLLRDFWHIDWDEHTQEILSGGNSFLEVHAIRRSN